MIKASVTGENTVTAGLIKTAKKLGNSASAKVGYTQSYGIYVHENLDAHHPVGQAKFLESPFNRLRPMLYDIVVTAVRRGATVAQAVLMAGLRLQRESQQLVPVDTGALKGSAFTELEKT